MVDQSKNKHITYITKEGYVAEIAEHEMMMPDSNDISKYYCGYLRIPNWHIVYKPVPKKVREAEEFLSDFEDPQNEDLLPDEFFGDEEIENLACYYDKIIDFFPNEVSHVEQFPDYDLIGFDTGYGTNLHLPLEDVPPELIRNTVSSTQTDSPDLKTYKTQDYVKDVLRIGSKELADRQKQDDEIWQSIVIKIAQNIIHNV